MEGLNEPGFELKKGINRSGVTTNIHMVRCQLYRISKEKNIESLQQIGKQI
jgi:hypothetical protein